MPELERHIIIADMMPSHVFEHRPGTIDLLQFLNRAPKDIQKLRLDEFREAYQILNSGASMRSFELAEINDQSFYDAYAWLRLGLPNVAEALFAVDQSIDPTELPITDPERLQKILVDTRSMELIVAHARVAEAQGNPDQAATILTPLVSQIMSALLSENRAFPATIEQFAFRNIDTLKFWLEIAATGNVAPEEILLVQQALTMAGSTANLSALDERLATDNSILVRRYQDARRSLRILQSRPLSDRDSGEVIKLSQEIDDLQRKLLPVLESGSAAFGVISPGNATVERLAPDNAGLLVGTQLNDLLVLTWVDESGIKSKFLESDERAIRTRVETLRSSITDSSAEVDRFDKILAKDLYSELFGWIGTPVSKDVRIVVDGALASLPFAALIDENNEWLGVASEIRHAPSVAWALKSNAANSNSPYPFLGIGAANYVPTSDGTVLSPLPETEAELRYMAAVLGADPEADVRVGNDASEAMLRQMSASGQLADYSIVSFATHGLINSTNGSASLALSLPQGETDDGFLTVDEIFEIRLNADLVILSACNTGVPDASSGLSDLASAFFYAGAQSLMVSHWEVDSGATLELMRLYALNSATEGSTAAALRSTIHKMASADSRFNHPRYWAAFFVIG